MSERAQTQVKQGSPTSFMPGSGGVLQRRCACGNHTMAGGECEACSKKKRLGLQTKLTINEPGDAYEQEADRIADQVMAAPVHSAISGAPPRIQRLSGQSIGQTEAAPASVDQALASPGRPLEPALRQDMEQRFGHDFSRVRVHTGTAAEQSAQDVNAHAYTVGRNMVFGEGRFTPGTQEGRRLIAHELTHVVQQAGSDGIRVDPSHEIRGLSSLGRAHELTHGAQQRSGLHRTGTVLAILASNRHGQRFGFTHSSLRIQRKDNQVSDEMRWRIELCVNPFYYDDKGKYRWSLEPEPDCSDLTIPADRARAWKCLNSMYWSRDGKKWTWPFDREPNCSDLKLPMPLETFRGESPEARKAREEAERRTAIVEKNRKRIIAIRKDSSTDVEALARTFTDKQIVDNGTIAGRVNAIMAATEHTFIPGLQTGIEFGQTGFRKEFLDPWESSQNQVGHFLTAVRLGFDPDFASNFLFLAILDAWGDADIPLRLIIGHEKEPDPGIFNIFEGFKKQYKATTEEDIKNFKAGNLDKIKVGTGKGNSMADLILSHKGWLLGRWIAKGQFKTKGEIADWIRHTLGKSAK